MLCVLKSKSTIFALASVIIVSAAGIEPASAQTCVAPPSGAVSWWTADGDATDSVDGNDGTLMNGATFAPGFVGDAFSFDGVDDFVSIPAAANLSMTSAYSVEGWVLSTGPATTYRIIASRGGVNATDIEIYIQKSSNDLIVLHNRGNGGTASGVGFADPPLNTFFHLAVTYDGSEVRAYYDGVEPAVVYLARATTPPIYTNTGWEIGRLVHSGFPGVTQFKGLLDEITIYDRALTLAEIQGIVDADTAGKCLDSDNDGLDDADEAFFGTDPNDPDSDHDGLLDGTEVDMAEGSGCPDPLDPDSDGDSLWDGAEVDLGTDPCNVDSDADGFPDNVDPYPLDPEGTTGFIEDSLRGFGETIGGFDLSLFDAKNSNARSGRQNAMCNKTNAAANAVAAEDYPDAVDQLNSLRKKIDGDPDVKDWMVDGDEKSILAIQVELMTVLLEIL